MQKLLIFVFLFLSCVSAFSQEKFSRNYLIEDKPRSIKFPVFIILKPTKIINRIPLTGSSFTIGARIDITTITHLVGGFATTGILYAITKDQDVAIWGSIMFSVGVEVSDGVSSSQGADFIDLASSVLGTYVFKWIFF